MEPLGKMLVGVGLLIAAVGLWLWLGGGRERGGLLPGDIFVERGSFKFYFPIVTCLATSLVLSFLFWLIDLGKWFSGENRVSEPLQPEHLDQVTDIPPDSHSERPPETGQDGS